MALTAREYHERTKHSVASVWGGVRELDWDNQPLPYKLYSNVSPIPLPFEWPEPDVPAAVVLSGEITASTGQLDLPDLARLLFLCAGVTRRRDKTTFLRAAPSAGALYPIELYLVCGSLPQLPAGLYHFEPVEFALRRLRSGDVRAALATAAADGEIARRLVTFVLAGIPWRTTWKYGVRGYRHLFWDAGTILANLIAAAGSAGLPARVVTGFVDAEVAQLIGVDSPRQPFSELPLVIVPVGPPDPEPPPVAELPMLELEVAPLSLKQVDEPELHAAHEAGTLVSKDAVNSWRRALASGSSPSGSENVESPPEASGTLDEVVLRRGSTRRFARTSVPQAALGWGMTVASSPVVADFVTESATLLRRFLIVHAVDGVEPGAYRWTSRNPELVRRGMFRSEAAHLCLDQALGGDAAFTVFECAELDALLAEAGTRAYRAAQLEAGIAAGRLQLAAFTLDLGGTGLTFYDDEVREFFATQAEPMLTAAIGAPDYDAKPGKGPNELPPLRLEGWGWSEPWM